MANKLQFSIRLDWPIDALRDLDTLVRAFANGDEIPDWFPVGEPFDPTEFDDTPADLEFAIQPDYGLLGVPADESCGYLTAPDSGSPELAACLIHCVMARHGIAGAVEIEWAETSSRMAAGEFGGGLAMADKNGYTLVGPTEMRRIARKNLTEPADAEKDSPYLEAFKYFSRYPEGGSNRAIGKLLVSFFNETPVSLGECLHPLDSVRLDLAKRLVNHYMNTGENDELRDLGYKAVKTLFPSDPQRM